jgi:ABC-type glycerol-3-phosphate transport system permease component
LGIDPKKCKSAYQSNTCKPMFMATLFTTANLWNQLLWPIVFMNEFITNWDIYTIEYYSTKMMSEIMLFAGKNGWNCRSSC